MSGNNYQILNFIADTREEWQDEHATFVPRIGDCIYPYERVNGVFKVEEVWIVGESNGALTQGTNAFVSSIPLEGSRLYNYDPKYYGG